MAEIYDFSAIERKWQQFWAGRKLYETDNDAPGEKFYLLVMFPYPSGKLHMGHVRNYIIADVICRQKTMRGFNVLHPMGWDAFGLPAENAAILNQVHPNEWTRNCIEQMKEQFDGLGIAYDWSREINTSQPDYYKWTQWLFLEMFHNDLAYQGEAIVNWCPSCATVLANEELDGDTCERCGSEVEPRGVPGQWFFKTTAFADALLDDLKMLDRWPASVRTQQENWIGRSEGVSFRLDIEGSDETMEVFTTRIDTIYGVTFMVLAPEHPLVHELVEGTEYEQQVTEFVKKTMREDDTVRSAADTEKHGVFTGRYAIHPLTGERVPIWVANYVLMGYGTGAIMAVPAHDQRDFEFARKYDIPVVVVIQPEGEQIDGDTLQAAFEAKGVQVNSGEFDGMPCTEASEKLADLLEQRGIGRRDINYRLQDWLLSRQRYWGAPIPIIYCDNCGVVPVPYEDLPVLLPTDAEFKPTGESPLAIHEAFVNTICPRCGQPAKRETDTMTTYVCSSWYYLRYVNPHDPEKPFRSADVDQWLPVDHYIGGVEHAVRHLLYARFVTKVLNSLGYLDFVEPFSQLFTQGMICSRTPDGQLVKMSKSKGNAVPADEIIQRYGADTARTFVLFVGPPDQDAEWSDEGVAGVFRFLSRVWRLATGRRDGYDPSWRQLINSELTDAQMVIRRKTHQTIAKATEDIDRMHFNTAVSAIMELTNELTPFAEGMTTEADRAVYSEAIEHLVMLLSPFAPHMCDELWERMGHEPSLFSHPWPEANMAIAAEDQVEIAVQVNGKVRTRMMIAAGADMDEVAARAQTDEQVARYLTGKTIRKVITVPDKLVNIVAN